VDDGKKADADDDRPPICPACGVTMGITVDEDGSTRYVCFECGFSDDPSKGLRAASSDPELAVAVLAGRDQASRIVILREGDADRLAMAARLGEQSTT
jgi:hypothetical protein